MAIRVLLNGTRIGTGATDAHGSAGMAHPWRSVSSRGRPCAPNLPISAKRRRIISQFLDVYLSLQPTAERALQQELAGLAPMQQEELSMTRVVGTLARLGAAEIITAALDKRFGPLDEAIKDQIALYPFELLEALILAQVYFTTLADLEAWLAANPAPPWVDPLGEWDDAEV
ncbi:MAG: DUF4351 domain-containing protein [Roseiflexus sp.]|nr:DUF4351 domain-containing protein [Roseiflexus sp.]MDW8148934.1 DUF4351 domain-containing protein [Roseiflexaceae bacterium]